MSDTSTVMEQNLQPDTGTVDKVAAGNPDADANATPAPSLEKESAKDRKAREADAHDKAVARAEALGYEDAASMKPDELAASLNDPRNFSSLLSRDTTHFDNVHFGTQQDWTVVGAGSSPERVLAVQALLSSQGANVAIGTGYSDGTEQAVAAFQRANGLEDTGVVDRDTWDALADRLFSRPA